MNGNGGMAAFQALDGAGVRWCLWRGSARTERAFAGASDFDLLVAPADAAALAAALAQADCRLARGRAQPGLEDWFVLGGPTGPLVHLHVHHRMVAGPGDRFELPWAAAVLAGRRRRGDGLMVADPVHECALVLIRCALALPAFAVWPWSPRAKRALAKVHSDLAVLVEPAQLNAVQATVARWLSHDVDLRAGAAAITLAQLVRLQRHARARLVVGHGRRDRLWCRLADFARALVRRCAPVQAWLLWPQRGFRRGGRVVVLTGGEAALRDGLARDLRALLGSKLDVVHLAPRHGTRAVRARARGMLALIAAPVPPRWLRGRDAELLFAVDAARPRQQQLAELVHAVWSGA